MQANYSTEVAGSAQMGTRRLLCLLDTCRLSPSSSVLPNITGRRTWMLNSPQQQDDAERSGERIRDLDRLSGPLPAGIKKVTG